MAGPAGKIKLLALALVHLLTHRRLAKVAKYFLTLGHVSGRGGIKARAYSVCCAALRVPTAQELETHYLLGGLHVSWHKVPHFLRADTRTDTKRVIRGYPGLSRISLCSQ